MTSDAILAITGNYEIAVNERKEAVLKGLKAGVIKAATKLKEDLREDTIRAGLGRRLSKTWRFDEADHFFPHGRLSYHPAAIVVSKAPHIIEGFDKGEVIRAGKGKFLAVPIPGSPAEIIGAERSGNRRPSKIATARRKWGDLLKFVPPIPGKRPGMLVLQQAFVRATGRVSVRKKTKTGKFKQGTRTVPLFWLVPQVRLQKRLNVARIADRAQRRFAARVAFEMAQHLQQVQS